MIDVDSTPAMAAALFATMARNVAIVRNRLARPLTLAEKVLLGHLEHAYQGTLILTFGGGTNEIQRDLIALFGLGMPRTPRM